MSVKSASSSLMPMDQALSLLLGQAKRSQQTILVELKSSLGMVLSEPLRSSVSVPPADNSAMDGYAINMSDIASKASPVALPIKQRITAGITPQPLQLGTAARIFTGAEIPEGANAVVMQEKCLILDDGALVQLPEDIVSGQNIRDAGQDVKEGDIILNAGVRIKPQHMGLIASVGIAKFAVYKPLKVAVLSTGDELLEPGEAVEAGKIYNSNRYALVGLIQSLGMECLDYGVVEDTKEATEIALKQAAIDADCIITSGGVSVGEEDHIKPAIEKLGKLNMWKVAIKPGKPIAFGEVLGTPIMGLPGNPVAAFVTFCLFARPYLLKCQGMDNVLPREIKVTAGFELTRPGTRRQYLRAQLVNDGDNGLHAVLFKNQSSGVLSSACWADGLAIIPIGDIVHVGDQIQFLYYADILN